MKGSTSKASYGRIMRDAIIVSLASGHVDMFDCLVNGHYSLTSERQLTIDYLAF